MPIFERFKNAWNAFKGRDPTKTNSYEFYSSYNSYRPDRRRMSTNNIRSIVSAVYNQIAVDCSLINIRHVRIDINNDDRYMETIHSEMNYALSKEANVDQTGRELIREAIKAMLDDGSVAIIPVSTTKDPRTTNSYDIYELRVGKIKEWFPRDIRVEVYDESAGNKKELLLEKRFVAIIENPFYDIMNEPNSTAQRLKRILNQLDRFNDESSSGKLDLIIQLPYMIKSETRRQHAEQRRKDIEAQLTGSKYGIAYTDGTERIVQLNRSLENNLWQQAKDLEEQLYNQLGFSKSIFDGTADEKTMLNYNNRTLEPILIALTEEMERKWISRTAQTQGQAIRFFDDPFRLVPVTQLAEIADKFTRNEIATSNEIRAGIGMKPVDNPRADELRNANLNHPDETGSTNTEVIEDVKIQNE